MARWVAVATERETCRVLVIGGGISALATAHGLLRADADVDLRLIEAGDALGGTMRTERVTAADGSTFLFERGPNGFLGNAPATLELVKELGLEDSLVTASPTAGKRYLWKDSDLCAMPRGPGEFLRTKLLSFRGRLRALSEPFRSAGPPGEDESIASFGRRRLGDEVVRRFLDPMVTGIWGGDVERLSLRSAFPRIASLEREHGSLVRGMKAKGRERRQLEAKHRAGQGAAPPPSAFGAPLHSFREGLGELVAALERELGERLELGCAAVSVERAEDAGPDGGWEVTLRDGRVIRSELLVVALPSPRAANLFAAAHPDLARALEAIPYAPIAVLCAAYRREHVAHPLDGYGFLVPRDEGLRTLGMIWTSSLFPDHVSSGPGGAQSRGEGPVSFRAMVGGAHDPEAVELSSEDVLALVERECGERMGLSGPPVAQRLYRYVQGIPQYNVGHQRRLDRIEDQLRSLPGVWLTGNAYRGVSMNDCIREGLEMSAEVLRRLRRAA